MNVTYEQMTMFPDYPETGHHTFYRVPFMFLHNHEDRVKNAEQAVRPLIERIKFQREISVGDNSMFFMSECGLQINIESRRSDLWIKVDKSQVRNHGLSKKTLADLDSGLRTLPRLTYKYRRINGDLIAYVVRDGSWSDELSGYIGLDAGSISINTAVVDEFGAVLETDYTFTEGDVLNNVKKSLASLRKKLPRNLRIKGSGVTGSGHEISGAVLNADVYETELDAHAAASLHMAPDVAVIFDIGGQDSKVMYIEDGVLDEAGMNKKCGAGTGSFLNAQAARLGISIEDFGEVSLRAIKPYRFSSMCTVFVGRDLIAEQAKGNTKENIIAGLHRSLAMNFFSTLGINKKKIRTPIVFQGGVAFNIGVKKALEECLAEARGEQVELIVPIFSNVMGAVGMALFAQREVTGDTGFRGFDEIEKIRTEFGECTEKTRVQCDAENFCDLVKLYSDDRHVETLYACREYTNILHAPEESHVSSHEQNRIKLGA